MRFKTYPSDLGDVTIATLLGKLIAIEFQPAIIIAKLAKPNQFGVEKNEIETDIVRDVLDAINHGKEYTKEIHLIGTPFQLSVWNAMRQIPKGKTISYKELGEMIGKPTAVRAIGTACGANPIPIIVPCHRVVGSNGKEGGFRWGLEMKRKLLKREE